MGGVVNVLVEERALGCDHKQCLGSIEDIICAFDYGQEKEFGNDSPHSFDHCDWPREDDNDDDDESDDDEWTVGRTIFWESQESLLQEILDQYHNSTGSKLRQEIGRLIEIAKETNTCNCPYPKSQAGCVKCLRRRVVDLLCNRRFNASLCTSKWKNTPKFPGGSHEYIEVIVSTQGRKKQVPFLIELEFRDEFRMAKACDHYIRLINQLPEIYIGKADHLQAMVRVVCNAAKRSTTEKKIHMGPWRKKSFMQMKWSAISRSILR